MFIKRFLGRRRPAAQHSAAENSALVASSPEAEPAPAPVAGDQNCTPDEPDLGVLEEDPIDDDLLEAFTEEEHRDPVVGRLAEQVAPVAAAELHRDLQRLLKSLGVH